MRVARARSIAAVALAALVPLAAGCDWGQYRGGAAHTGASLDTRIGRDDVGRLELLWSIPVETGDDPAAHVLDPIVVDGTVVTTAGEALRAYDAVTGAPRWAYDFESTVPPYDPRVTVPSAADGVVLVGYADPVSPAGASGRVARIDLATGAELPALDDHSAVDLAVTSPVTVTGAGDVWFSGGEVCPDGTCIQVGVEGVLASGRTVFGARLGAFGEPPDSAPAVGDGRVFVGGGDGVLRAFDADGDGCAPYTEPDVVTCSPLWSAPVGAVIGTPVVSEGHVIVVTPSGVVAYPTWGPSSGGLSLPTAELTGATAPAVDGLDVYVGTADGLQVFLPGCAPVCGWTGVTGTPVTTAPTVANGVVYVASSDGETDGQLHAFSTDACPDVSPCAPLWSAPTPGVPTSSPVVANGRVYVGTSSGRLAAYGLPAG